MKYIDELEAQNEQLRKQLAHAEWHAHYGANKLIYEYLICFFSLSEKDGTLNASTYYFNRQSFKFIFKFARQFPRPTYKNIEYIIKYINNYTRMDINIQMPCKSMEFCIYARKNNRNDIVAKRFIVTSA